MTDLSITTLFKGGKTVPMQLRFFVISIFVLTTVFCFLAEGGAFQHRYAAKTIGRDAAQSVFIAYEIKIAAQTLDADIANILAGKPGQDMIAVRDFETNRIKLSEGIIAAAENVTFDDAERETIKNLQDAVSAYMSAVAKAEVLHERRDAAYIVEYHNALTILQDQLVKHADALETANADVLEATYELQNKESVGTLVLVLLAGAVLLCVQVYAQLYLRRHFKRLFNKGLLVSSSITVLALVYITFAFISESMLLKAAKEDAYTSILALYSAKSFAHEADAAQSRYLLDTPMASVHEDSFNQAMGKLVSFPAADKASYDELVSQSSQGSATELKAKFQGVSGALVDELRNITFEGEQAAAAETVKALAVFAGIDGKLRQLEKSGKHEEAVALCVGISDGEAHWAFGKFVSALDKTMAINRDNFERDIEQAMTRVSLFPAGSPLIGVLIAISAFLGLRPRMREFPETAYRKANHA